jgi:hypothetical protein
VGVGVLGFLRGRADASELDPTASEG